MKNFFIYRFKNTIRQKVLIFWLLVFPIVLVSFFQLAFSNIKTNDIFKPFAVGMVAENKNNNLSELMNDLKIDKQKLFIVQNYNLETGQKALADKKIAGLIIYHNDKDIELQLNQTDVNQMLLTTFLNNYKQKYLLVSEVASKKLALLNDQAWLNGISAQKDYISNEPVSEKANEQLIVIFYSAIAMTCLYGALLSSSSLETIQGNLKKAGSRLSISPLKKSKMIIADYLVGVIVCLISLTVLLLYLNYVLNISLGAQLGPIILIAVAGSSFSVAFGYVVGIFAKFNEALKIAIIMVVTMLGSFLAGMMVPSISYYIQSYAPLVNYLNPVYLITNSFYILYYYDSFTMTFFNLGILMAMAIVCLIVAIIKLRGDSYDTV